MLWGLSKLEMAVQRPVPEGRTETISPWGWSDELRSWTWPGSEGKILKVRVYSSGDQVRLLLNGKEIGVKPVSADTELKAEFDVPYAAGELKAVALSNGQPIAELAFKTAGKPAQTAADGGPRVDPAESQRPLLRDRGGARPGRRAGARRGGSGELQRQRRRRAGGGGVGQSEGRLQLPPAAPEDVSRQVPGDREAQRRRGHRDRAGAG